MKTYQDLLVKLINIGFKDITNNYGGGPCRFIHVGYGHNNDPIPRFQLRVFRTQEGGFDGPGYKQDWLDISTAGIVPVTSLEQIWVAALALAKEAMTPRAQETSNVAQEYSEDAWLDTYCGRRY